LVQGLYRSHFSTSIDHASGTAEEQTLRGIELAVPLTLYAAVLPVAGARHTDLQDSWPDLVRQALPLIQAVGAHRSRGLGRATMTLEDAP
jgi:hypothetical protein